MKADRVIELFTDNNQDHMIPDFSLQEYDQMKHLRIVLFDQSRLSSEEQNLTFLRNTGQKYEILTNDMHDVTFALINTKELTSDRATQMLESLIMHAIHQSLGIETLSSVIEFARKKQVTIALTEEQASQVKQKSLSHFRRDQLRLDLIKQLRDMLAITQILKTNAIESNQVIFEDKSLKQLAEEVHGELLLVAEQSTELQPVPQLLKDKLGVLLHTKKMNQASFFSFQFKLGVYLPVLCPFIAPVLMTLIVVIRTKLYNKMCKKKTDEKEGQKVKTE